MAKVVWQHTTIGKRYRHPCGCIVERVEVPAAYQGLAWAEQSFWGARVDGSYPPRGHDCWSGTFDRPTHSNRARLVEEVEDG